MNETKKKLYLNINQRLRAISNCSCHCLLTFDERRCFLHDFELQPAAASLLVAAVRVKWIDFNGIWPASVHRLQAKQAKKKKLSSVIGIVRIESDSSSERAASWAVFSASKSSPLSSSRARINVQPRLQIEDFSTRSRSFRIFSRDKRRRRRVVRSRKRVLRKSCRSLQRHLVYEANKIFA